ncbi:hypothetical protein NL676_037315 [Syzygium grande]|nr:hypothetical protein NL676_037315 [Syzygium grande]
MSSCLANARKTYKTEAKSLDSAKDRQRRDKAAMGQWPHIATEQGNSNVSVGTRESKHLVVVAGRAVVVNSARVSAAKLEHDSNCVGLSSGKQWGHCRSLVQGVARNSTRPRIGHGRVVGSAGIRLSWSRMRLGAR